MIRTISASTRSLVLLAAVAFGAPAVLARDTPPDGGLFVDRVDVSVVNVEVFVRDRDGKPVTGLSIEDFVVTQDGEPVEISNFYAAERPDLLARDLAAERLEDLATRPPSNVREIAPDRQLNLVVYVDNFNIRPNSRKRVLDGLGDFLEERAFQGDNVMLVSFMRAVDIVQPLTRDPERIRKGLARLGRASTYRQTDDARRLRALRHMVEASREGDLTNAYGFVRTYVEETKTNMRLTAKALQDVLRSLAGLPGRKALLYVSDGLPARAGEQLYQQLADLFDPGALQQDAFVDPAIETIREDQGDLFDQITREANAQQVTFYTVDARGSRGGSLLSAAFGNQSAGAAGNTALGSLRDANLQEPLIDLAEATGGRSVLNTLAFDDAFVDAASDFDSYYSLGYRLPEGGDGAYHAIDVIVRHPDYQVRHRAGFIDKPEEARVADRTLASLMLETTDNPMSLRLGFGQPEKKKRRQLLLPVLVRIPLDNLTFVPQGKNQEARLMIYVVVQDEEGGLSEVHTQPYPVSVPRAQLAKAKGQDIGYSTTLKVRPGTANVAVGVWDQIAGVQSFHQERVLVEMP